MNKLYCVMFIIREGLELHRNFWNECEAVECMKEHNDWHFTLAEDNDCHKIWEGR